MTVTYIEHSGFMLEMEEVCFLFDYYKGKLPEIKKEKDLVVFVSHKHEDHYNKEIFELVKRHPGVKFVLSKDIPIKWQILKYEEEGIDLNSHILTVSKNMLTELTLSNGEKLEIETLRSTDEGVAYFLTCGEKKIYHAGDLNLWVWEGESKQYNNNMKAAYFKELEKLKGREIDAAFVPLDNRQGKNAFQGLLSFLEYTQSRLVFPMHFFGEYKIIDSFLESYPEYKDKIALIRESGQKFYVK